MKSSLAILPILASCAFTSCGYDPYYSSVSQTTQYGERPYPSTTSVSNQNYRPDSDFRSAPEPSAPKMETKGEKDRRIAVQLGGAVCLKLGCQPADDDELSDSFLKAVGRYGADEIIESSINEALPDVPTFQRRQLIHAFCAVTDGDILLTSLVKRNEKDAWMAWLNSIDPNYANAAEVADFLSSAFGN